MDSPQIKPSFFDEAPSTDYIIWKKGVPVKKASETRLMEGILFKRSSRTNFWKSRYFVLFEDRLVYYKNGREEQQEAYCNVQNMRIEKIYLQHEKDEKFGLRLIHNNAYFDIYARSRDVQEKWLEALSKFCVLTFYSSAFVNIKVIGKGSFARVFLAKRRSNGMELAVKTFDKNMLQSVEKAKASLINEINVMRKLQHDNIISLYEVYESDNHIYLVVELLNGGELFDRICRKGQYSERDASILMKNLLSALTYMHSKGIMHRDIKPENLILKDCENDWDIKIADFGLATPINGAEQLFKRCGTPGYVAPEILADEKYDEKVDVFSAGVILYILLTGGSPFHSHSYTEIIMKNKDCQINFNFWEFGQQFSDAAVDLLMRMLTKDPMERISAAEALRHPWIQSGGMFMPQNMHSAYLNYAQNNMRIFQEEQEYNMALINAHCQDPAALERSVHAPNQLINGRMVTVADSYNHFYLNSPDIRKPGNMPNQNYQMCYSPQGNVSLASTADEINEQSSINHELSFMNVNPNGYYNENTLLAHFTGIDQSNACSGKNTPMVKGRKNNNKKKNSKKAMGVQDALLKYLSTQMQQKAQNEQNTNYLINNVQMTQ